MVIWIKFGKSNTGGYFLRTGNVWAQSEMANSSTSIALQEERTLTVVSLQLRIVVPGSLRPCLTTRCRTSGTSDSESSLFFNNQQRVLLSIHNLSVHQMSNILVTLLRGQLQVGNPWLSMDRQPFFFVNVCGWDG